MKKHINIPIFIPHLGCPNDCVFCNQRTISGKTYFDITAVETEIENHLLILDNYKSEDIEIAFFGGSFTGINRNDMTALLEIADKYYVSGKISSVRISTRPDYIDEEILEILKKYHVSTIELGIQSLNDAVLKKSKRGHTSEQSVNACGLILQYGFDLVGQMMIGLPDSTATDEIETAAKLCELKISAARIYPIVVFNDTELADMVKNNQYQILTTPEIIERSSNVLIKFIENNIKVIRIGLCSSENLSANSENNDVYSGYYHPAIGELVENNVYYRLIAERLNANSFILSSESNLVIECGKGSVSKVIGQKKINKEKLIKEFGIKSIKVIENNLILDYNINIVIKNGEECFCV